MNLFPIPQYTPEMFKLMQILFISSGSITFFLFPCLLFYFDKRRHLSFKLLAKNDENKNFKGLEIFEKYLLFKPNGISLIFITFLTFCILTISSFFYFGNMQYHILTTLNNDDAETVKNFVSMALISLITFCLTFLLIIQILYAKTMNVIFELKALYALNENLSSMRYRLDKVVAFYAKSIGLFIPFMSAWFLGMSVIFFG